MAKKSKCSTSLIYFFDKKYSNNLLFINYFAISIAKLWIDPLGLFNAGWNRFEGGVGKGATGQIFKNSDGLFEVEINFTPLEGQRRLNTIDKLGNSYQPS